MYRLLIKNGVVFDPLNEIEGEVMDILIENGIIVEEFTSNNDLKEIDASGKTVIPAALDIHTHVASQQANWARLLGMNNLVFQNTWNGLALEQIARNYISMGYTFILEANVFPSLSKQTIFDFQQLPVLDKAMLLNVSNLWPLELEYQRGKIDEMAIFLSDLLEKTKGFGFKVYNPFESENWDFKVMRNDLSKQGRLYNFNALDVYETLTKCNEQLNLPHSIHAHIEGIEHEQGKKNLDVVLEIIKNLKVISNNNRSQVFHLAHASSYNIDGDNSNIINYYNNFQNFDLDLGFISFNEINPLITSDRRLINSIARSGNQQKVIRSAVESEGDLFASLRKFDKNDEKTCFMWANAIDLALNIRNKYQVQISINFPNYGNIADIPEIATWLMSYEARNSFMDDMNINFLSTTHLKNTIETISFNEFIIMSRASPAKSLGLGNIKGNLGLKSDGDMNILDLNVNEIDLSKNHETLKKALLNIDHVIKGGKIVKKQDSFDLSPQGKIYWSKGREQIENITSVLAKKKEFYQKYGSIFYDSLKNNLVDEKILREILINE